MLTSLIIKITDFFSKALPVVVIDGEDLDIDLNYNVAQLVLVWMDGKPTVTFNIKDFYRYADNPDAIKEVIHYLNLLQIVKAAIEFKIKRPNAVITNRLLALEQKDNKVFIQSVVGN